MLVGNENFDEVNYDPKQVKSVELPFLYKAEDH